MATEAAGSPLAELADAQLRQFAIFSPPSSFPDDDAACLFHDLSNQPVSAEARRQFAQNAARRLAAAVLVWIDTTARVSLRAAEDARRPGHLFGGRAVFALLELPIRLRHGLHRIPREHIRDAHESIGK